MSVGSAIVIGIIAVISFIYSMLTLPIYFLVQQPWKMRQRIKEVKVSCFFNQKIEINQKTGIYLQNLDIETKQLRLGRKNGFF